MDLPERTLELELDDGAVLRGDLAMPEDATAVVVFAHGTGSSRLSPRNRYVAQVLRHAGFATLLIDLLTEEEEEAERFTRHLRFDIELLSARLADITAWLGRTPGARHLAVGYFGASTGAAAALVAAARSPERIGAVVSRGGRPDLAGDALRHVRAPTLLIVGGADEPVLELNEEAFAQLRTPRRLEVVAGATHLFEEPGALARVAELAREWFEEYLPGTHAASNAPVPP